MTWIGTFYCSEKAQHLLLPSFYTSRISGSLTKFISMKCLTLFWERVIFVTAGECGDWHMLHRHG